jgi:phosphoribosylglycinamide formyltransferase-1
MEQQMTRIGILISGRGSNMQSLVRACRDDRVPASVALVVSNRSQAQGLDWAREHGLQTLVLAHRDFRDRESHDMAVVERLRAADVDWVCLAGYMRLLSPVFINAYPNRILNIHPSLLPAFPGLHAQEQAWKYGARVSGCTVHLVDVELDHGPIVLQRAVEVAEGDTAEDLADRILVQEHKIYPEALRQLITRAWRIEGRRVVWEKSGLNQD